MITHTEAVALAKKLKSLSPLVHEVQLIGSVAQKGFGNDADFVVITDTAVAKSWWEAYESLIQVRWPWYLYSFRWIIKRYALFLYSATTNHKRRVRLEGAANLLGIELTTLIDESGEMPDFELFLMPEGWQEQAQLNESVISTVTLLIRHRNTHNFMKRIAVDATPVA